MNTIMHHIPDPILIAYASGHLAEAFALVVASHVSLCGSCRATLEAHHMVGGALLEAAPPVMPSSGLRDRVLGALDAAKPEHQAVTDAVFPAPVQAALRHQPPHWSRLGRGIQHMPLISGPDGSARLLLIPAGQAVPEHSHRGLEMTLVLQGGFSDADGQFGRGDVEIADDAMQHQPVAAPGEPCICLAATEAPLRFRDWAPRLMQPLMGI